MRATASPDTILEGAVVPDRYVARVVPPDSRALTSTSGSARG
jgi:hypothetical protein